MLAASHVRVVRGSVPILRGVSVAARPGEVLAIIGPNGAGKSTLLHALSGALEPDGGEAALDGRPLRHWPRAALARRRAVLPQAPVLTFPFRVFDVVLLGRGPHAGQAGRREDLRVVEAALRETDVAHLADRIYPTLSGGERQRVQLARVLAQIWPKAGGRAADGACYLLLDEPTNNLDIAHQQAMMATALRFAGMGYGVLAVLHDPNLAAACADRILVLGDGAVVAEGRPEAVLTETLFAATFGLQVTMLRHPATGRPVMLPGSPGAAGPGRAGTSLSNERKEISCSSP